MRRALLVLSVALAVSVAAACTRDGGGDDSRPRGASTTVPGVAADDRPRGGSVRVGVWVEPDPTARHLGGAAVRSLVLPQLFVAMPDGQWGPSLVEPGSDRTSSDARSASFRLRSGAVWSDGTPLTVDDLRRAADGRFVAGVDGPDAAGTITVRFTHPLPGWRRLWSFTDSISPPRDGVWGGPFVVAERTPGLETVLRRNEKWWGPRPFLDEVRLILVPDATIARLLFQRGELDVLSPPAYTVRSERLRSIAGAEVDSRARSGWSVALLLHGERLTVAERRAVVATVDRRLFVGTLLKEEATVLDGFAGPEDATWREVGAGSAAGLPGAADPVDLVGMWEEPMTPLLQRSMQRRAKDTDGRLELRNAEADRVYGWIDRGEYDAAVVLLVDAPQPCWTCRWGSVDDPLARRADGGDADAVAQLEAKLRDAALVLPLWRPKAVVAWRGGIHGVAANGYALSPAWNAAEWWRSGPE